MKLAVRKLDRIDQASVPLFVVTMLAEGWALSKRDRRRPGGLVEAEIETSSDTRLPADPLVPVGYERKDTAASLSLLAGSVAIGFVLLPLYERLAEKLFNRRISNVGSRRGGMAAAMVLWDFLYYWEHRWMHEVRLLWAHHVTHHSSQRYNLSTALRQPWSGFTVFWVFLPMPLLGFPRHRIARAGQLNLLYQYWIHTEAIDRLPARLEQVLNTPSNHRVHHGANRQYLDRNYGGILIVWDKLFGTFEPERRTVRYGLTTNVATYHPLRLAYAEFAAIGRDVRRASGWRAKLGHVFGRPGWTPGGQPAAAGIETPIPPRVSAP